MVQPRSASVFTSCAAATTKEANRLRTPFLKPRHRRVQRPGLGPHRAALLDRDPLCSDRSVEGGVGGAAIE